MVVVMVASPDPATRITRTESPRRFNATQILPYVAVNKDAFPNSRHPASRSNHSVCQIEHRFLA